MYLYLFIVYAKQRMREIYDSFEMVCYTHYKGLYLKVV